MPAERPVQIGIMKAKTVDPGLISRLGPQCFAQAKLRGQRCRVQWINDFPILVSSYGNAFCFMNHIQDQLLQMPRLPYDGELYNHDFSQEQINSICGRTVNPHPESHKMEYHIFDLASEETQQFRFMQLDQGLADYFYSSPIRWIGYSIIHTSDWQNQAKVYLDAGFEGIILRKLDNYYKPLDPNELAKRPSTILKFKPNEKDIYPILDVVEGTGWAQGMLGSFVVDSESGPFRVGTGRILTKAKRAELWTIRETLPGRKLVVKHEPITTVNGLPICTVAYELI